LYKEFENVITNIDIDQEKIDAIMSMRKFKSKKELVDKALDLLRKQVVREKVLSWKGTNVWEGDLDQMRID
jgi:Arc/MetJ family transcription regulator